MVEEPNPVVEAVFSYRMNRDLTDVTEPLGIPRRSHVRLGVVTGIVADCLFRIRPVMTLLGVGHESISDRLGVVAFDPCVPSEALHPHCGSSHGTHRISRHREHRRSPHVYSVTSGRTSETPRNPIGAQYPDSHRIIETPERYSSADLYFSKRNSPFGRFVNLVRKFLDKFPDAAVDRFRMKVAVQCLDFSPQFCPT
jgi:hypothetical protein